MLTLRNAEGDQVGVHLSMAEYQAMLDTNAEMIVEIERLQAVYEVMAGVNDHFAKACKLAAELEQCKRDRDIEHKAAASLEEDNERLRAALDKLARLGNEPNYGSSDGNRIAQRALAEQGSNDE